MNIFLGILAASAAVYFWKIAGFSTPERLLENPRIKRLANLLTIALLSALVGVQGFTSNAQIVFDARVPAVIVAAILLLLRAPFVVTVAAAALVAGLLRLLF